MAPAVKRLLPPLSASDARSNISTRAPDSRAAKAAQNAAFPAPTTITSNSGEDMKCEIPGQVVSEGCRLRSRRTMLYAILTVCREERGGRHFCSHGHASYDGRPAADCR